MADRVIAVAKAEISRATSLIFKGLKSGAYLYPFQGIIYLLSHQTLRQPLQSRLIPTITLGAGVTTAMFLLTYVPQLALLALTSGPLVAPVSAALLVIRESSAITAFISSSSSLSRFILPSSSRSSGVAPSAPSLDLDAFDATLILKGHESLVAGGREIRSARSANVLSRLGGLVGMSSSNNVKSTTSVTSTSPINRLIRSVLYLPLNFVPVVGTLLFLAIEGKRAGQGALDRYFELKGFTSKERDEWLEGHEGDYISFGIASAVLEMVPFASFIFTCTNTVGAALWAANIEAKAAASSAPESREQVKKAT